jgi:hypothetical protein
MPITTELGCVRSLLLMTAEVGLAAAVTGVEVCDIVDIELVGRQA